MKSSTVHFEERRPVQWKRCGKAALENLPNPKKAWTNRRKRRRKRGRVVNETAIPRRATIAPCSAKRLETRWRKTGVRFQRADPGDGANRRRQAAGESAR